MNVGFAFPLSQLHWWLITVAAALALLVMGLRMLEGHRLARLNRFVDGGLAPRLLVGYDAAVRRPLFWLTLLGFGCMAVAIAQPHWGRAWQEVQRQSRDILVCLDVSESMGAPNPLPSRLERAKQKIISFVDRSPGDRFGLVAFSGAAELQCPLTLDHGYFKAVLKAIDTDIISLEGTDIAEALRTSSKTFREEEERIGPYNRNSRAILLISDGEQVSGDAVVQAEETAEQARVHVIGVGSPEGAEIRIPKWMARARGAGLRDMVHLSRLDEDMLIQVATAGRGSYVRSTVDNWDSDQVFEQMQKLSARDVAGDVRLRLVNRYQWPLAAALVCFAAEGLWLIALPWLRTWRMRRVGLGREEKGYA